MNKKTQFIRIKNVKEALDFYKKNLNFIIKAEYFLEKPHHQVGKHAYVHANFQDVDILFQVLDQKIYFSNNIYITFDFNIAIELTIKKYFAKLAKDAKKILQKPNWNFTSTFYRYLIDKFGIWWEFKAF